MTSRIGRHDSNTAPAARATVLYDGECDFCVALARRFAPSAQRAGFQLQTLPTASHFASFRAGAGETTDEGFDSMMVIPASGATLRYGEAVAFLARHVWWGFPLRMLAALPGGMFLIDAGYRWVARNRGCLSGGCSRSTRRNWPGVLPVVLLPAAAIGAGAAVPAWVRMWLVAAAFFVAFKLVTLWRVRPSEASLGRRLAYLFAWVGMDAREFLAHAGPTSTSPRKEWVRAGRNLAAGAVFLWLVAGFVPPEWARTRAWVGLIGLIWMLHFGLFHFLAVFWRGLGVAAAPIMDSPMRSTSLGEFWGRRWNSDFRVLSHGLIFEPLRRRARGRRWAGRETRPTEALGRNVGGAAALLAAFLFSGVIHDLVISVPAGGGYGLPTLYFTTQGLGVWLERSRAGRRAGLGSGRIGWVFTLAVTIGPVGLLFHDPFLTRVALPMLDAVGAF